MVKVNSLTCVKFAFWLEFSVYANVFFTFLIFLYLINYCRYYNYLIKSNGERLLAHHPYVKSSALDDYTSFRSLLVGLRSLVLRLNWLLATSVVSAAGMGRVAGSWALGVDGCCDIGAECCIFGGGNIRCKNLVLEVGVGELRRLGRIRTLFLRR